MKKILYSLIAILAIVMSSCSNDDIEITRAISIKVNPSGVIAPFTYEVKPGELESFSTDYKLRVHIFAYNEKGILVAQDVQYLKNYASIANSNLNLEKGTYTIAAVTDVVKMDGSNIKTEYWKISGTEKLSTTKITDAGFIGGPYKILGMNIQKMTIEDNNNECKLNPQPVGALCLVEWINIHTFPTVTQYTLAMTKSCEYLQLNELGSYDISEKNENGAFKWRLTYNEPSKYTSKNYIHDYYYVLPMKNVNFKYTYTADGSTNDVFAEDPVTVSFEAGGEYWFALDLCNKDNDNNPARAYGDLLNGSNSAKGYSAKASTRCNANTLFLADYAK